jgi:hypothetical protein
MISKIYLPDKDVVEFARKLQRMKENEKLAKMFFVGRVPNNFYGCLQ